MSEKVRAMRPKNLKREWIMGVFTMVIELLGDVFHIWYLQCWAGLALNTSTLKVGLACYGDVLKYNCFVCLRLAPNLGDG